ncbi:MAG TPA: hypothetical protein VK003_00255 [Oceanobacillus sp.]|nr:hypothetical protein [Oceanobacillus sp.]
MQAVRNRFGSNTIVGLAMLMLLAMFAFYGPGLLSDALPGIIYEGVPCEWLRQADDRANHQSLLGRGAPNPIVLSVAARPLPTTGDGFLYIYITVANNSLGTVPFVYDPNAVIVGDNGTSGLGVIFNPANSLSNGTRQDYGANIPEQFIRLLGPRQRCVHTIAFPAGNVLVDPSLTSGTAQVRAYYRNNSAGSVVQPPGAVATPIYTDMGLWTGFVESGSVTISRPPA